MITLRSASSSHAVIVTGNWPQALTKQSISVSLEQFQDKKRVMDQSHYWKKAVKLVSLVHSGARWTLLDNITTISRLKCYSERITFNQNLLLLWRLINTNTDANMYLRTFFNEWDTLEIRQVHCRDVHLLWFSLKASYLKKQLVLFSKR